MKIIATRLIAFIVAFYGVIIFMVPDAAATTSEKQPISAEKMWEMKRPGNPVVSPDGKWSLFTVSEYDIDESKSSTDIFMMNNDDGTLRQLNLFR
jgi:tricorn protease-like protein